MDTILQHWGLIDQHLDGILLSAGLIALFSVVEVCWPASRQRDVHSRIVNIVIGVIVSVFAFLCTVLIAWFATLVWRDGLIGLVVAAILAGATASAAGPRVEKVRLPDQLGRASCRERVFGYV